jgi:type IV pilus biogenesis protein CpaD/CtpE
MQPTKPDVTIINYGHDHVEAPAVLATEMTNLLDSLRERWESSDASIVLTVQNPGRGSAAVTSAAQQHEIRRIARDREVPVADINHAFHNVGDLSRLMVGEKHPGPSGSMIWATTVNELFTRP